MAERTPAGAMMRVRRPLRRGAGAWLTVALLALSGPPVAAAAQAAVTALPVQGLRFGTLTPGAAAEVSPLDASRRATVELVGSGAVTLQVELPTALAAGGGALPVRFRAGDGRITFPKSNRVLVFDPNAPVTFHIPPGVGGAYVHLGGEAAPTPRQAPGAYAAAIRVHVVVASSTT